MNPPAGTGSGWSPYCGPAPGPADWLAKWNLDPLLLTVLAGLGLWWWLKRDRIYDHRLIALAFGLTAFLFVSPFCALGSALFAARSVHHVVLAALLAPVLALIWLRSGRALAVTLAVSTLVHAVVFWAWHFPPLYAAAMSSDLIFWLMQATIAGTAVLLWAGVFRASPTSAVAALLATMVQMGALGALLTFARSPLYAPHWQTTAAFSLSPLEDQQLAGLIMWAPGSLLYLLAAMMLLYRALQPQPAT